MMRPRNLLPLVVASVLIVHTSSQYVDFLQGLQSFFQPYQLDGITTKRPETRKHGGRHQTTPSNPTIVFPVDHRITTSKPSRKSTRPNSSQSPTARPKAIQSTTKYSTSKPKSNENRRNDYGLFNNGNIFFPNDDSVTTNSNRKTTQWSNKGDGNPVTPQWSNKNDNRNPQVSSSITQSGNRNENRNPTQWDNQNNNRNPQVSSNLTQSSNINQNRNPQVGSILTQSGNRNETRKPTQWGNQNNNRNPQVSSSLTQSGNRNENRNPTTQWSNINENTNPTQWGNQNNNRNPQVSSGLTQSGNRNENRNPTTQWSNINENTNPTQWGNQNNNRNPQVSSSSSQSGNRNENRKPQLGNKNENRNPDVSGIRKPNLGNWNKNVGTIRPVTTRPGVKPAPVDESRPPITNRPSLDEPELEVGPDEDDMSSVEKRRYLAIADEMCETYKALNVKKVVALPLSNTPEVVEFNVSKCTPIKIPLIIGGTVSSIEEFPHMSLVGWKRIQSAGYSWKCGGSLVSDQYVLTAGHCTYQEKDSNTVSGSPHAVQLGSTNIDGPGAVVIKSSSVIRHPKYKQRRSYYDVALIKLASRVRFSDAIRPACLGVPPPVGQPIVATGWGRTEFGGEQSLELRSVSLPIWNMQDCKEIWGTSLKLPNGPSSESHVCAGERNGGKDTCQGDSGGPAQVQDGCIWRVVAVTSSGRSCGAPDTPALYAKVPRVFVAAQVFGTLDDRFNNQINSNGYQSNKNQDKEYYNLNQNNRNPSYNSQNNNQNNRNTNQNNQNNQQNTNNNLNNQNTNQYYQDPNYNNNRVTTVNPNLFDQANYYQNQNNFNQNQNYNQDQNFNQNQYYQNGYVTEGWNPSYNRGYEFSPGNNEYRVTERPWWSR